MGKTNLLDAIYYLCMGKSAFKLPDSAITMREASFFRLEGVFDCGAKEEHIIVKVIPRKTKSLTRNNYTYQKLSEHIGLMPVVLIGPDDVDLIRGGSDERRKLMDHALSQKSKDYLHHLIRYQKILKQRNALLKQNISGKLSADEQQLLTTLTNQLLTPGNALHEYRSTFVKNFAPLVEQYYNQISGSHESIKITYQSSLIDHNFRTLLEQSLDKDLILQRTTTGPHRDDLILDLEEQPVKKYGSQGQVKSFLLAIKLAQYEWLKIQLNIKPVLILDDLLDRLDQKRVTNLLEIITSETFGQVFISDTHLERIQNLLVSIGRNGKFYKILAGSAKLL